MLASIKAAHAAQTTQTRWQEAANTLLTLFVLQLCVVFIRRARHRDTWCQGRVSNPDAKPKFKFADKKGTHNIAVSKQQPL